MQYDRLSMLTTRSTTTVLLASLVLGLGSGCAARRVVSGIKNAVSDERNETAVRAAHDGFYAALNTMFTGDIAPMNAVWSHDADVSDQGPFGSRTVGWDAVGAHFKHEAGLKLGGKVASEDVLVRFSDDMAYTVCVEHGEHMTVDGKPVDVRFRATNIFRLQDGAWKMVHHHTDLSAPLQAAVGKK